MCSTRLEQIIAAHRRRAAVDSRDLAGLAEAAEAMGEPRSFELALRQPGLSVIAEVKRRSPSAGNIKPDLDPAALGARYQAGGAACLSVLTDAEFFGGSENDLQAARNAVGIPVLRKDFTVDERDVYDARIMGADAILLIVAALGDDELVRLYRLASELHLSVLVEVHDERELDRAVSAVDPSIIGVNQRDLHTFEIDTGMAESLIGKLPSTAVKVAESGIVGAQDAQRLARAGYDAVLVGSSLVKSGDPSEQVRAMRTAVVSS